MSSFRESEVTPEKRVNNKKKIRPLKSVIGFHNIEKKIKNEIQQELKEDLQKEEKFSIKYPKDFSEELISYDNKFGEHWKAFNSKFLETAEESLRMDIRYFGVNCGSIALRIIGEKKIGKTDVIHLQARMKSAPFYKMIYTLDDTIDSFVEKKNFLPVKYVLVQRESKQNVDDLQLFDRKKMKNYFWYYRIKNGQETKQEASIDTPFWVQDSYSALYFVRGLPLTIGDEYEFPIVTRGKIWLLKIRVLAQENLLFQGKQVSSIKIQAETHFPGVLEASGDILFWFSSDLSHTPIKFSAKVKIGSVEGERVDL